MTSSAHREKEDARTELEQRRTDLVELERRLETDDELGGQLETIMSGVEELERVERSPKSELEDLSADERDIDDAYAEAMLERSAIDGEPGPASVFLTGRCSSPKSICRGGCSSDSSNKMRTTSIS